jgi:Ca2+/Na+ antiporter
MEKQNNNSLLSFLIGQIFFILAVYLYFVGWVFNYYYLTHFSIPFIASDIPFYYFFIYSYSVMSDWYTLIIMIASIITIYFFMEVYVKRWLCIIILLCLFPILFYMAREKGLDEAKSVRMGAAQRITFFFKVDHSKSYPPQFVKANTDGKLRIITQTKDRFYVLYQPKPGDEEKEISYGSVYDIPMTDVFLTLVEIPGMPK